jgi:2-polyprenyl-3-methyl-5-hydroxy-6-metoxy-1,4-benzoquinol methylase
MTIPLVKTSCANCRNKDEEFLFNAYDRQFGLPGVFRVVRCRQCGLYYLNPRPADETLGAYYPATYYAYRNDRQRRIQLPASNLPFRKRFKYTIAQIHYGYAFMPGTTLATKENPLQSIFWAIATYPFKNRFQWLPPYRRGMRLLDVGCGAGFFLDNARSFGWETWGVDISGQAVDLAKKQGHRTFQSSLQHCRFPNDYFDVVRAWSSLEHMTDPFVILGEMHRILKRNGTLIIAVPNMESATAKLFKTYWYSLDVPRHLYWFRPPLIRSTLEKLGFNQIRITTRTHPSDIINSLKYYEKDHGSFLAERKILHSMLWSLLRLPCFFINKSQLGDLIIAQGTKT